MKEVRHMGILVLIVCLIVVSLVGVMWDIPLDHIVAYAETHRLLGAFLFALLMFASTVFAPLTTLPLVPLLAPILGPFTTAIASIIGWTTGATVAFLIARHGGRPALLRHVDLQKVERYESLLPKETHFLALVMLRMLIPVDLLSYALGFLSTVKLGEYVLTTIIGVSWFSFAFAYMGDAIMSRNYVLLGGIGVASILVLSIAYSYLRKGKRKNTDPT